MNYTYRYIHLNIVDAFKYRGDMMEKRKTSRLVALGIFSRMENRVGMGKEKERERKRERGLN